ncbi:MAG: cell division coordinator CpoB [Sodalis sp. Psp]|nr:cell division coordinator CpoB [Sodalis sp. Psp]MCR3756963.1 cell division coordinator CpoB [Sodalis sp. Ppy]
MVSNFRPYLLNLSLLIGIAAVPWWTATAQEVISGSVKDRINQLERIYNSYSQLLIQLQQQLADNQHDIDLLRGQVQENQYQLSQVVKRQKQVYQQVNALSNQPHMSANSGGQSVSLATVSSGTTLFNSIGDADAEYNEAMALMLQKKQYDQAIGVFQNFVKRYPDSTYQPNANYWLGQLNYNKGKKEDAAYYFALVVKKYPKSSKAPDALLKVGIIMQEKGQKDKARAVYRQIGKLYPSENAAKQAQKRLAKL